MTDLLISERPLWSLAPEPERVEHVDQLIRRQLAGSLAYLRDSGAGPDALDWDGFEAIRERIDAGPVSPWVFALYSKLVADLSNNCDDETLRDFADLCTAASLPAVDGIVAMDNPDVPSGWWAHYKVLLDTDPRRPFNPATPTREAFDTCSADIERGFTMLEAGDPDSHDELRVLLRAIVLAAPEDAAALETFNGASTFFMWGATLLNAARTRDLASTIDVLVHEGSHMLLFGASADKGLTTNAGEERHASPLRSDGRPVDGIFHACYVATRVYVVMDRLLDSDRLPAGDRDPLAARRHRNGEAARASLETLNRYAKPTETGEAILDTLRDFWAAAV